MYLTPTMDIPSIDKEALSLAQQTGQRIETVEIIIRSGSKERRVIFSLGDQMCPKQVDAKAE